MTPEKRELKQDEFMDDVLIMYRLIRTEETIPPEDLTLTMDSLHEFLQKIIDSPVGLRRKVVMLHKFTEWWVNGKR